MKCHITKKHILFQFNFRRYQEESISTRIAINACASGSQSEAKEDVKTWKEHVGLVDERQERNRLSEKIEMLGIELSNGEQRYDGSNGAAQESKSGIVRQTSTVQSRIPHSTMS